MVSHKSTRVAVLLRSFEKGEMDPHYLCFFESFNRRQFFEAHEVLEDLWLKERGQPDGLFYKGLIQLAGAFVHVQKQRRGPAMALLALSRGNLSRYSTIHQRLAVGSVLELVDAWVEKLRGWPEPLPPMDPEAFPRLRLIGMP